MDNKQKEKSKRKADSKKPFHDFEVWFKDLIINIEPAMIVSIARGAVRFLQLNLSPEHLSDIKHISHHAIPFIKDEEFKGAKVLIFDDSVIFGSTMNSVKRQLEEFGSIPICCTYAVDGNSFYGDSDKEKAIIKNPSPHNKIALNVKHRLMSNEIRQHHALLVHSILRTPLHYNLDFPTFEIVLDEPHESDIYQIYKILNQTGLFRRVEDVSSPISIECDIPRYSGLLHEQNRLFLQAEGISYRPYGKIRVTHSVGEGKILITPILQVEMNENFGFTDIKFYNTFLQGMWSSLKPPREDLGRSSAQALFRLLTAFVGLIAGKTICETFITILEKQYKIKSKKLLTEDMGLVLGTENTDILNNLWESVKEHNLNKGESQIESLKSDFTIRENIELQNKMKSLFLTTPRIAPEEGELIYESVGKLLLGLRAITDSDSSRMSNPEVERLETGLTFEDIKHLISYSRDSSLSDDDLSFCVDLCVDHGLAVPKIVREDHEYMRAFYCGEDEDKQPPQMFKTVLNKAYTTFLKKRNIKHLTPFDFQKLCVALKDVIPYLPISTGPYKFGYTSTVGQEQLIKWLTVGMNPPLEVKRVNGRNILIPNEKYCYLVRPTWENYQQQREFYDAFDYYATTFCKVSSRAKLLLTTCRTHRHTFNSVAFEAHSWAGDCRNSFESVLVSLKIIVDEFDSSKEIDFDYNSLYWSIQYLSEAQKKYQLFCTQYTKYKKELRKKFCSQGQAGERWWNYISEMGLFDETKEAEIEFRFRQLLPLLKQMTELTAFVTSLLVESKIISYDKLKEEFESNGISVDNKENSWLQNRHFREAAENFNAAIDNGTVVSRSIIKTKLPEIKTIEKNKILKHLASGSFDLIAGCFQEIKIAVEQFCPKYKVNDLDFPFSPKRDRKILEDGSMEIDRGYSYVLAMDIIKGTHSEQTNEMKKRISEVLHSFRQKGLIFEDTGNDCFVATSIDPLVLYDAAKAIRVRGEDLKTPGEEFGGTRKGIYYGPIVILKKTNGETLLHDRIRLNVIPAACSMLGGVDKYFEMKDRNSKLILSKEAMEKCAGVLGVDIKKYKMFPVSGKHFPGHGYFLDLE